METKTLVRKSNNTPIDSATNTDVTNIQSSKITHRLEKRQEPKTGCH